MNRKWQHLLRLIPLAFLIALLSGCGVKGVSTLIPMGKVAKEQEWLMLFSFLLMLVVVLVVGFIFVYVLVRYRKKRSEEEYIPKQVEGNAILEVMWTVIPILILVILAFPTIKQTFALSDVSVPKSEKNNVVQVEVTAHQYWWQFKYPDQKVVTAEDLVVPVGKTIIFHLTSADVIHSFWVPALGGKVDANPGQTTTLKLEADHEGVYRGRCAELCGASHAMMYFNVKAVSPSDFNQWIKDMKKGPAAPTTASAKEGQELFNQNCMSCHAVGDQGGQLAPNLTNFADRKNIAGILDHNKENLAKWVEDPPAQKPGALMPPRGATGKLTDDQIKHVADYLFTLSVR